MDGVTIVLTLTGNVDMLDGKTDEELVELSAENQNAVTILIKRYVGFISSKARKMVNSSADMEDIAQEGLLGLLNAIWNYDSSHNVKFSTFAEACINNKMKTAIAKNSKAQPVQGRSGNEAAEHDNPESIFMRKVQLNERYADMTTLLTKRELEIFKLFLNDSSYEQIAQKLAISPKSVDNAIQRVRRKLRKMWRADHFIS